MLTLKKVVYTKTRTTIPILVLVGHMKNRLTWNSNPAALIFSEADHYKKKRRPIP